MRYELQLDRVALRRARRAPRARRRRSARPPTRSSDPRDLRPRAGRAARDARPARRLVGPPHPRPRAPARRRRPAARRDPARAGRRAGGLRAVRRQDELGRPRAGRQRDGAGAHRRDAGGARAALWRLLLGLDLVRTAAVAARARPTIRCRTSLSEQRRGRPARRATALFVRLVDVAARAGRARSYATPVDVVLEVDDAFCPWNAGR